MNNAGPKQTNSPFLETPDSDWDLQFAYPPGRRSRPFVSSVDGWPSAGGSIVNIISLASARPAPFVAPYAAAKAGMEIVTKVTALELGPKGVRSNGVSPAFVPTERNRPTWELTGFNENSGRNNPLGRIATPQDIAGTVAWLVSDAAGYVNGQVITVDGGSGAGVFMPPPAP